MILSYHARAVRLKVAAWRGKQRGAPIEHVRRVTPMSIGKQSSENERIRFRKNDSATYEMLLESTAFPSHASNANTVKCSVKISDRGEQQQEQDRRRKPLPSFD